MKNWLIIAFFITMVLACFKTKTPLEVFLRENGFEGIQSKNSDGYTPLILAIEKENMDLVAEIISAGADVNDKSKDGRTPILYAIEKQNEELVDLLLSKGALFDYYDSISGLTPFEISVERGNVKIIRYLVDAGADRSCLYRIKGGRAGLFGLGMKKEDILYNIIAYDDLIIDSSLRNIEGVEETVYKLFVDSEHDVIEFFFDETQTEVFSMTVYNSDFMTEKGIAVGSTYEEATLAYGELTPEWGDGGEPVLIVAEEKISFVLENDGWWLSGKIRKGSDPSNAEIRAVLIW